MLKMINKRFLVLIALCISAFPAWAQGVQEISLVFQHSLRIPNHWMEIKAINYNGRYGLSVKVNPANDDPEWTKTKIDTMYALTEAEFVRLKEMVTSISTKDLMNAMTGLGEDGTIWRLSFGDFQTKISFRVWSVDYDTKKRGLERYAETCKYMIELAGLKFRKIR